MKIGLIQFVTKLKVKCYNGTGKIVCQLYLFTIQILILLFWDVKKIGQTSFGSEAIENVMVIRKQIIKWKVNVFVNEVCA